MERLIAELRKIIRFKETTAAGDVVLIAGENPQMVVYALVDAIEPDTGRSDQWWHLRMKLLSVPPQQIAWTLREPQFTGKEIFTMGGDKRFLQAVSFATTADRNKPPAHAGHDQPGREPNGLRRLK